MSLEKSLIEEAEKVLNIEAQAILHLKSKLKEKDFALAVDLVKACTGKVVMTGMGKSGLVARKIASTLSSTGTPSFYVHPAETAHGDMGMISSNDVVIALSLSGETKELAPLLEYCARKDVKLIAMTGGTDSSLSKASILNLDCGVDKEACPLGLAPTASSTAMMAMGDALAMTVLLKRGFRVEDFAELHPGGRLGFRLLTKVKDVMHVGDDIPLVTTETSMREVVLKMTRRESLRGVVGVTDRQGQLVGIITDGDIRRRLEKSHNPLNDSAQDLMSVHPKTIDANELAEKALFLMEQFSIQVLFVTDQSSEPSRKPVGILHLQDLVKAKVR